MHRAAAAASPHAFLGSWGMLGTGPGEFDTPYDVSIGPNGDVFVLDGGNERVEVFTSQGSFIRQWATGAGLYATGYSHLDAIAVNSSGDVYVAGWGFNFHFDSAQPLVARFSTSGAPHGAFLGPEIEGVSFFRCNDGVVAPNV